MAGRRAAVTGRSGFPADGTAQVLAPLASARTFRAERPAFVWLAEREVLRFLKIWHFTIAGHVMSALLFVVVFGFALEGQVSGVPGIPYAQFILPGLAAQAMLNVGYINGTTSLFEARHYRYVNDVLASPLLWWEVNAALVAGGIVREALTAAGVFAVGVPLTGIAVRQPAILIAALVAVLVIGAQLGVLVGIFYAVSRLPGPWRLASELDPAFYVVQSLRIGFLPPIFRGVSTRDQPDSPGRRRYCRPCLVRSAPKPLRRFPACRCLSESSRTYRRGH